jgi:hypothetical protein
VTEKAEIELESAFAVYKYWPFGVIATPIGAVPVLQLEPQLIGAGDPLELTENGETAFPVVPEPVT